MAKFTPTIHPWNQQHWQNLTMEPERSNHALLFVGDPGLGKKALALALAHFVLTENHSQSESLFDAASHPDMHVLMPEVEVLEDLPGKFAQRYLESHTGKPKRAITIDQIRALGEVMTTFPHISKYRVVLIYHAETMNRNASNALLKNLEEPPANTLFVLVSDDYSQLPKTVRSRCSLVNFRAPEAAAARAWLLQQQCMPEHDVDTHLAMAHNQPLLARQLYEEKYIDALKAVFTDVNSLWNNKGNAITVAASWQKLGSRQVVGILQKLFTDMLRCSLSDAPASVFFPVQIGWVQSVTGKMSRKRLLELIDELVYTRKMLATTVDELLLLECVSGKISQLPQGALAAGK